MSQFQITTAARKQAKLRVGVSGPSGSGKTYSALLLGRGLTTGWDKVLLIDSENGSGELYSDLGEYKVIKLEAPYSPERYIGAIEAAEDSGVEVIIIDSITHEWDGKGGCLELNEILAASKYKGNTWSAWSETTPRHQRFIEAITTSKCHVITTVRNKIDTVMGDDKKVKKVGTKEITREGFEYELTVNFNVDRETHRAMASKDRTNLFEKRDPFVITIKTGEELAAWNAGGAVDLKALKSQVLAEFKRLEIEVPPEDKALFYKTAVLKLTGLELTDENLPEITKTLAVIKDKVRAQKVAYDAPENVEDEEINDEQPEDINIDELTA